MTTSPSQTSRRRPSAPARRWSALCEDCGAVEAASVCECCAQELCPGCWGGGDSVFCGPCRRADWEDARPEEVPSGLLLDELSAAR